MKITKTKSGWTATPSSIAYEVALFNLGLEVINTSAPLKSFNITNKEDYVKAATLVID